MGVSKVAKVCPFSYQPWIYRNTPWTDKWCVFVCVLRILTLNYDKDSFSWCDGDLTMIASNIGRNL